MCGWRVKVVLTAWCCLPVLHATEPAEAVFRDTIQPTLK